ncbi:cysteine desulfurase [Alicyclobacillus tolerans]|uniref:cysteine desulfurase family protein n=1 Tax=Alicyclobacillus tolerans TaxID=90970 RepID=UPI001F2AF4AD|nr:cysteine desulfurase family protein [Alicyclobacillus tolerans]MCF8567102.1 cysteine desulfurase [Alicyclobacillus tolerans]
MEIKKLEVQKSEVHNSEVHNSEAQKSEVHSSLLYLDYCATTPIRPEVAQAIARTIEQIYGNPSSLHQAGRAAKKTLEAARETFAQLLTAKPSEILFTASGTEANNLAILGALKHPDLVGCHVITTVIEHPAVKNAFRELESRGHSVTYLPVNEQGVVQVEDFVDALRPDTRFVSVMMANNETGALQPVNEIAQICRSRGIVMHSDAVQAFGKVPIFVNDLPVDLLSLSAHKVYGPKGVGILYVKRRTKLFPVLFGGGQEKGLRSGTENVALVHGAAAAARMAVEEMGQEMERLKSLRDELQKRILDTVENVRITCPTVPVLPHVLHLTVADVLGETVLLELDRESICVSAGSACSSGSAEPSPVLQAMNVPDRFIHGSLRISLGKDTTQKDLDRFVDTFAGVVAQLRNMLPSSFPQIPTGV